MHGAHILPKPAHFGYMTRESCREPALFPPESPSGTHEAKKLPRLTAREHATAKCRHGSPPGNAPRRYLAETAPLQECFSAIYCREDPRLPRLAAAGVGNMRVKTGCISGRRQSRQPAVRRCSRMPHPRDLACGSKQILQRNCRRHHGVGRLRANETPTNSTTRADASKKP